MSTLTTSQGSLHSFSDNSRLIYNRLPAKHFANVDKVLQFLWKICKKKMVSSLQGNMIISEMTRGVNRRQMKVTYIYRSTQPVLK